MYFKNYSVKGGVMVNRYNKPKLSSRELVRKLKEEKGVTFKYISEEEAIAYLQEKNNYMRTAAYRKNYQKYTKGEKEGQYQHLDFAYLQELSVIDMHLRFIILKMCSDIEHALKVQLIRDVENELSIDGYDIVNGFLMYNPHIVRKIEAASSSPFTCDLIYKYFRVCDQKSEDNINHTIVNFDCPVWVLTELLSFGDFIKFYEFYYTQFDRKYISPSILHLTRKLRNACAHNNCLLSDLSKGGSYKPAIITQEVAKISTITKTQRIKKLTNRTLLEFVAMMYLYKLVVSEKVKYHRIKELKYLFNVRMVEKKSYFKSNQLLASSYDFACKVMNYFFKS